MKGAARTGFGDSLRRIVPLAWPVVVGQVAVLAFSIIDTLLVGRAGTTMQGVVQSVQRVASIIGEIAAASQTQSQGIESVNQSLYQIDASTQQNAALVEQAAAAAESLKTQAASLESMVRQFQLDGASA